MVTPAARALLDTSVLIDPPSNLSELVTTAAISTITLAELAYGLHTADPVVNTSRQLRYQRITDSVSALPYTDTAAQFYGALCARVRAHGRDPRPRRFDLLIASVAAAEAIPLVTRNTADFAGLGDHVRIIAV